MFPWTVFDEESYFQVKNEQFRCPEWKNKGNVTEKTERERERQRERGRENKDTHTHIYIYTYIYIFIYI